MPTPPAPAGDYTSGGMDNGYGEGGFLEGAGSGYGQQPAADHGSYLDGTSAYDPNADTNGNTYYEDPSAQQSAPPMGAPAMQAAAVNPAMGEMSVQAPYLEQVSPSPRSLGGSRGEISDLVLDVEVQVDVCLGDAALTVEEFLEMGRGSVVELDHAVDASIELKVKGRLVARGQLVTINGNYGMRITEMLGQGPKR